MNLSRQNPRVVHPIPGNMRTIENKIKNKAQRIARLGAYLASPYGPTAKKERGLLRMTLSPTHPAVLTYEVSSGLVQEDVDGVEEPIEVSEALVRLGAFEEVIVEAVRRQLRSEVLEHLVEKRLRKIARPANHGFTDDLRRRKKPSPRAT